MEIRILLGEKVHKAREVPGIYAWYYAPPVLTDTRDIAAFVESMFDAPVGLQTHLKLSYGLHARGSNDLSLRVSTEGLTVGELAARAIEENGELVANALSEMFVPYFARPLYIGIASNLHRRVYGDHYNQLVQMREEQHKVSRFLRAGPSGAIERLRFLKKEHGLRHSFALEARVRELDPRYLKAYLAEFDGLTALREYEGDIGDIEDYDDKGVRRAVERLLHLVTQPVCGRI